MRIAPIHVTTTLHYYAIPEPLVSPNIRVITELIADGILEDDYASLMRYKITEKGVMWIKMILATPFPTRVWVDPRQNQERVG